MPGTKNSVINNTGVKWKSSVKQISRFSNQRGLGLSYFSVSALNVSKCIMKFCLSQADEAGII